MHETTSSRGPRIVRGEGPFDDGWIAPTAAVHGRAVSRLLSPQDFSLWLVRGHLPAGASLSWDGPHGDEVLYVQDGELEVGGRRCPTGGAVVIEAGVPTRITATSDADVLHFGPTDPAPPNDGHYGPSLPGRVVHVVGPGGTWSQVDEYRDTRFFADSTCETCRVTLLHTGRATAYESAAHSHSQDELIHVLHGELQLGAHRVGPGDTLAIAKDVRYRFRSDGFAFLNYRRDVSHQTLDRAKPPVLEGGEVHGFEPVMDLR
jgi:quercetin dioxygenase-like cupin family protein